MNPVVSNILIIIVILLILFFALKNSIAHFKGQGSCCGGSGGNILIKPKKLKTVSCIKTIRIDGMHCDNCYARVHNILNSIEGVSAKVNGKKGEAIVKLEKDMDDAVLSGAIADLGYTVSSIQNLKE